MSRPATSRLKVNPPLGRMPTLQFVLPAELAVDPSYQRSIEASDSQALIRRIAQFWNWDLCQPLVVSRRDDGSLFVIDGQHRLEAAKLRGDIPQLPCVIVAYANAADEAASFVHLNQQRRPLTKLDLFKAAIASEDPTAVAIMSALTAAGLSVAPHNNHTAWKPGMVSNIGGIEAAWRQKGEQVTSTALRALSQGFEGQVLQYAGTLFPGIAVVCGDEMRSGKAIEPARFDRFLTMLSMRKQVNWRADIMRAKADNPLLNFGTASAKVMQDAWARANGMSRAAASVTVPKPVTPAPVTARIAHVPRYDGKRWCEQCERQVEHKEASGCNSRFCSLRPKA
ncbi:hypothetical protein J2Y54_000556 [Sphingomonas sp. BE123]|uniref:ParB/RepB/Spo0J family partition protein n=1 Tax=Sphingomonas sp. BE123 TaxID=2817842 RepID=UPI0028627DC0|nr:ParB/RepB/Spo0J family partition protein [Sphingomonas sp. BE123]MDR6851063.1 hypothetical protein [Sphingomonas sp. BE123]